MTHRTFLNMIYCGTVMHGKHMFLGIYTSSCSSSFFILFSWDSATVSSEKQPLNIIPFLNILSCLLCGFGARSSVDLTVGEKRVPGVESFSAISQEAAVPSHFPEGLLASR